MNIFDQLKSVLEHALHVRPEQLKGTPGIKQGQEALAAAVVNTVLSTAVHAALVAAPHVAENALHVRPEQLKGAPGIHDHEQAANVINGLVQKQLGQPS